MTAITRPFYHWTAWSDRELLCPHGHRWHPDFHLREGRCEVRCRQCGPARTTWLQVIAYRDLGRKLVLAIHPRDWQDAWTGDTATTVQALGVVITEGPCISSRAICGQRNE